MNDEYNDDTPMPFGEHRGKKLSEVPAAYLHWWWTKTERSNKRLEAYAM